MNRKVAVTLILVFLAVIALIAHVSTTTYEFSQYNWAWNGTSDFFAKLDARNANDLVIYDDLAGRNDTLLLIIAPSGSFSEREIIATRYFLQNGNTLFIADETGTSNLLLKQIGSKIRIQPASIHSPQKEFSRSSFIIAYTREPDPLLTNVSALTLNRPSIVNGGETLVSTSFLSWNDINMNYNLDMNESFTTYGIIASERIGRGTLYVLSDPSIFVNGMQKTRFSSDNEVFTQNLLSLNKNILVEQLHSLTRDVNSIPGATRWLKNSAYMKISVLILSILIIAIAYRRRWI